MLQNRNISIGSAVAVKGLGCDFFQPDTLNLACGAGEIFFNEFC